MEHPPKNASLASVDPRQPDELVCLSVAELQRAGQRTFEVLYSGERLNCFRGRIHYRAAWL
jgi:hypothetical protein